MAVSAFLTALASSGVTLVTAFPAYWATPPAVAAVHFGHAAVPVRMRTDAASPRANAAAWAAAVDWYPA